MATAHKTGSAMLIVLLAVAIVAMLYMVNIQAIFGPTRSAAPTGIEQRPWLLEELLVAEGESVRLPKSPKPTLNAPIALTGEVRRNDEPRGTVRITLDTDGRVQAKWEAAYTHAPKQYTLTAEATGNIDVKTTYKDADGSDRRRLFFIAQGPYRLLTDDPQTGRTEETGTAWLLGYLRPDGRADGTWTLTTDRQWAAVYTFAAKTENP